MSSVKPRTVMGTPIAQWRWRRRQVGYGVIAPLLVALLLGATALVLSTERVDSSRPTPPIASVTPEAGIVSMLDWITPPRTVGAPARAGTLLYRSCASQCTTTLVRPNGKTFAMDDVFPDLANRLDSQGLLGATLSHDALWLGYPEDGGYTFTVGGDPAVRLDAGPEGSAWEMLDWGESSRSFGLAQWSGRRVIGYASVEDYKVHTFRAPESLLQLLPVDSGGYTVRLAQPLDVSEPVARRPRVTSLSGQTLNLTTWGGAEVGEIWSGDNQNLSSCMRPDETLAGPLGVPMVSTPPPARAEYSSASGIGASTVFVVRQDGLVPSAVIRGWCNAAPNTGLGRYDLPQSSAGEIWTFLGVMAGGETAMTRQAAGSKTKDVVLVGVDGRPRVVHSVPVDAQVLMPGLTVR